MEEEARKQGAGISDESLRNRSLGLGVLEEVQPSCRSVACMHSPPGRIALDVDYRELSC